MEYSGYVYLIGSPIFGWYKIGKSITPEVRIKDLGILLPFKIHVIGVWGAKNHHQLERALHEIHKDRRINGEWGIILFPENRAAASSMSMLSGDKSNSLAKLSLNNKTEGSGT